MRRDLEVEDRVRELRVERYKAQSLTDLEGFAWFMEQVDALDARALAQVRRPSRSEAEIREHVGELAAYDRIRAIIPKAVKRINDDLESMGASDE